MDIVHNKMSKGYHPLRYQTKAYDKCTKSLSVFTQDEWQFLEHYRWLRHFREFYKSDVLFWVMNNAEAENDAERNLRNFELSNKSVRCPDASTLHPLIAFVKRLVRLFPHTRENVQEKTRIILLLTRITSFHVYVLERYDICMIRAIPAFRVTSNHAYVISL